jgi:hypothetical protein
VPPYSTSDQQLGALFPKTATHHHPDGIADRLDLGYRKLLRLELIGKTSHSAGRADLDVVRAGHHEPPSHLQAGVNYYSTVFSEQDVNKLCFRLTAIDGRSQ